MTTQNEVDLSAFDVESGADQGARLELIDKNGKKSGEWIYLLGADSQEYQRRFNEQAQRRLARLQRPGGQKITQTEMDEETIDRLVVCTKDWSFNVNGEKVAVTPKSVEGAYRKSKLVREQVEIFINERANFLPA